MAGPQGAPGPSPWPQAAPHIPLPARTAAEGAALRPLRAARRGRGGEGRGRARAGGGDGARAAAGPRRRRSGPAAPGTGVFLAPSHPYSSLDAAPSLLLSASNRPRACAHDRVPAKRPAFQRFTPARGPSHRASFCSRLVRGLGRIIGERELCFCQSLYGWMRLEVGRGNGEKVKDQ